MRILHHENPSRPPDNIMADSVPYPAPSHYVPMAYYAPPAAMQVPQPPSRPDPATQRKRPKYTRSKTGCLTCRAKKIKCDESKPNCMRCTHGQRECTWPEGVPTRKKPVPKREQQSAESPVLGTRPSTAGSSGLSDSSTPPTRNHTPPSAKREPVDLGLPPMVSRRHSEPVLQLSGVGGDVDAGRRQQLSSASGSSHGYPAHAGSGNMLPAIPEVTTGYPPHHSYHNHQYSPPQHYGQGHTMTISRGGSQHEHSSGMRSADTSPHAQWTAPSLVSHVDPNDPYFPSGQERNLVGHSSSNLQQVRYQ